MTDILREIVLPRLDGIKKSGGGFMARCPAHEDRNASLSISEGRDQPVILHCFTEVCTPRDIAAAAGIPWDAISKPRTEDRGPDTWMPCGHTKVAEYEYRDADSRLAFAVARCSEKGKTCQGFRQWRPDPTSKSGKKWSRKLPDGSRAGEGLPYRLPEILVHSPLWNVWIVEGEKDADRLWSLGIPATCNAEGAGKWTEQHGTWLAGRDIMIVADRDMPGWAHAESVARSLLDVARSIEVVQAAAGKDISDHLDAGHTLFQVVTVALAKEPPAVGPDGQDVTL